MSDCRKAILHPNPAKEGEYIDRRMHDTYCVCNEKNEYWKKNKKFESYSSVLKKYRGKGVTAIDQSRYADFVKVCFNILWELILEDMILRNYAFKWPHINGGYIFIGDFNHPDNGRYRVRFDRKHANPRIIWRDFLKYTHHRIKYYYVMELENMPLKRKLWKLIQSGHTYPKITIDHGKKQ